MLAVGLQCVTVIFSDHIHFLVGDIFSSLYICNITLCKQTNNTLIRRRICSWPIKKVQCLVTKENEDIHSRGLLYIVPPLLHGYLLSLFPLV